MKAEMPLVAAVRRKRLRSVEHPAVAGARRGRPHAGGVAAGGGLGQAPRANLLAARQRHEELLLLLFVTEQRDVRRTEAVVRGHRQRDGGIDARKLLDADAVVDRRHPGAAVLLVELDAEQPERRQLRPQLGREVLFLIPLADVRPNLGFREFADAAAEQDLLLGRTEVHES